MINHKYSSGLVSQSFWFVEFKRMINLLNSGKSESEVKKVCLEENLFAVTKEYRAKRIYAYLWNRIKQTDETMRKLFIESDLATQKLINFICILKNDRLFFEFIYEVYREKAILGFDKIEDKDINIFFNNKEVQNDIIAGWTDGTKKKLRAIYINYMVDANLLSIEDKEKKITLPVLDSNLERYLEDSGEVVFIKALTGVR